MDDNPINLAVAQTILEAAGADVVTAGDGLEALEILETEEFDTILMDVHMPRLGGIEALARIRASRPTVAATPVIALSADAMDGVERDLAPGDSTKFRPNPSSLPC